LRRAVVAAALLLDAVASLSAPRAADVEAAEEEGLPDRKWFVGGFGGFAIRENYTEFVSAPWDQSFAGRDLVMVAVGRELGRVLGGALTFEAELMYGFHFGGQAFHEFGGAIYARWSLFPWNDYVRTTLGLGIGPSYTTQLSDIERAKGHTSKLLNMANLELTLALPAYVDDRLLIRLEHRSGLFGAIDGAREGSNYLMFGYKRYF
jgi:hypothetical protein